jgi:ParB family chromosome partitioning protein
MAKMGMLKNVQSRTGTQDSQSVSLTVKDIPVGDIEIRENIRNDYSGIEELADSIRQHGLIQPITVYPIDDIFIVKTGHRRFMACKRLYETEPERFHSIRCILTNRENLPIIQLVENVQREDLSQLDLYNALSALKEQGMSNDQIAAVLGKAESYVKYLFVGVKEIKNNPNLENAVSYAGITIQDIAETKGIPNEKARLDLLDLRKNGEITRSKMRQKVKELKSLNADDDFPETASPVEQHTAKISSADDGLTVSVAFDCRDNAILFEREIRKYFVKQKISLAE